ncbi:MAG: helix-turn-helix domain-containing protein [Myxococcota bacterium]|nr:helix-turn-helix domain-containing protein [Myxococcota bacterium]
MSGREREERLLDAAAALFVRLGYDKTSVSDIAREAGVSKGAVYLAFESKDALFEALLLREMMRFSSAWARGVEAHPRGGTVGAMYEVMLRALDASPFVSIIFRRDRAVLGRYLQRPGNVFQRYAAGQPTRHEAVVLLQEAGAIRRDVDPKVAAHLMNMIAFGLVSLDDVVPAADIPETDALVRGIADFMDRALTPEDGGDSEAGKRVIRELFEGGRAAFEALMEERRS